MNKEKIVEDGIDLGKMKLTKSGPRFYINIPAKLIKHNFIDPEKEYYVTLSEVQPSDFSKNEDKS